MRLLAAIVFLVSSAVARAMVGGAPLAEPAIARHVVLIVGSRGTACTGTAVAQTIVLTAAHCVLPGADYKWVSFDAAGAPTLHDTVDVEHHPQFDLKAFLRSRATADVALLKLAEPLPASYAPAPLSARTAQVMPGEPFVVAGTGVTVRGDGKSGGKVRAARLVATGHPGPLQLRLVDPSTGNDKPGLGACTGDSGAPAFDLSEGAPALYGVVSWSTAARNEGGCGGLTGITPLARYRGWIDATMRRMGAE